MKYLLSLALQLSVVALLNGAVNEAWVQRYNNPLSKSLSDSPFAIAHDADGNVIVIGITENVTTSSGTDMLTVKYSGTDGAVIWKKRFDGPARLDDYGLSVAVDGKGNVIVVGGSNNGTTDPNIDSGQGMDIYIAKYAGVDGALIWERYYNNPLNTLDEPTALVLDSHGNAIVAGLSHDDFFTTKFAAADGTQLWERRYAGINNGLGDDYGNYPRAVAVDASDNVVVTGYSENGTDSDYYTAKYAGADGALLWEIRYDGPIHSEDDAYAVAVDAIGNVVVTGASYSTNGGAFPNPDIYTAKYAAADGALLWERRFSRPNEIGEAGTALTVDRSGNVIVAGHVQSATNGYNPDFYIVKYAATDGAVLWEKTYNGPDNNFDAARAVALDPDDNVIVTGSSASRGTPSTRLYFDYYTAKYAAESGDLIWERRFNGPADEMDEAAGLTLDAEGNVFVTGYSFNGPPERDVDFYTAKYAASNGALMWEQRLNTQDPLNLYDKANAVVIDSHGNVIVTGTSDNGTNMDIHTIKYAAGTGALLWERRYDGPSGTNDTGSGIAVDSKGNVIVTGSTGQDNGSDFYTAKYAAADGALLWERNYNGTANAYDAALAVAVDGEDNLVVLGSSDHGTNWDFQTIKYAGADGSVIWERRFNGPANRHDQPYALALDNHGNVVVAGISTGGERYTFDGYTAKYAGTNGALIWECRYAGPAGYNDYLAAVAVDSAGNVAVTGSSGNGERFNDTDLFTAKYSADDGTVIWEKRYSGRGEINYGQGGAAVAMDKAGNVIVTGFSFFEESINSDYYTAKYAAADGAVLWERHHGGPYYDFAHAMAVDEAGNVVVTGTSYNTLASDDLYTAKYAATDGALLWEKRYNGPANGRDYMDNPRCLALGPNGMVAVTGYSEVDPNHPGPGYDFATVVYRQSLSIELISSGVRLRFTVSPGQRCRIERAPSVTGPWEIIASPTAPANGLIEFVDINTPTGSAFYRTRIP